MSMMHCFTCETDIDTDFDAEHMDECPEAEEPISSPPSARTARLAALKDAAYTRDEKYPFERLERLQTWILSVGTDMQTKVVRHD